MRRCIAAGVSKVNVNKLVLESYYSHLEEQTGKLPHTILIEEGVEKVVAQTMEWMDICGSTGKCRTGSKLEGSV
jgi:fructose-bisphosphate aldolase class II